MALSKIAKKVKKEFLRKNPHLSSNHPPVHLDESLELIEKYFEAVKTTKSKNRKQPHKKENYGFHDRRCFSRSRYFSK